MNKPISISVLCFVVFLFCSMFTSEAAIYSDQLNTKVNSVQKKKTTKKLKHKRAKPPGNFTSKKKGIISAVLGGFGIFAVVLSIAASFALSKVGVALSVLLGFGAGIAAIIIGIRARKAMRASGEKGSFWALLGIIFGSITGVGLLVLSLGALFG